MGWDNRFLGKTSFRRYVALLAFGLLVLGVLARPAIPDLADWTSPDLENVLSERDQQTDPVTKPVAWPSTVNSTVAAVIVRMLGEPARGFPPSKKSMPLTAAEGRATEPALLRYVRPDVDDRSPFQISAIGSARTPTGPPLLIV